jgi:hypothetical protein
MEEVVVRQIIIEEIENRYQQPYAKICMNGGFDLLFIPKNALEEYNCRATWVASFFFELPDFETVWMPSCLSQSIYLDDETGEIWWPCDPERRLNAQERRAARKERRHLRGKRN